MSKKARSIGFTLVELMVVIVVIGILVAMAVPRLMVISSRARASECRPILNSIMKTQQAYFAARDRWGSDADSIGVALPVSRNFPNGTGWFQYDVMVPSGGPTVATGVVGAARTYTDAVLKAGNTSLLQAQTVNCVSESGRMSLADGSMKLFITLDVDPLCLPNAFNSEN